jgi:rubrerythrin
MSILKNTLYDGLKGEVLEGGQRLTEACQNLEKFAANRCSDIIDFALAIEYAAFDLYRVMAQQSEHPEAGQAFLAIAQAEKGHMRALARSIEKCQ